MITHSLALVLAVGALGAVGCVAGSDATEDQASVSQDSSHGGGFTCVNTGISVNVVQCVGSIAILPININIKDVRVLDDNELNILSGDLNNLSILDGGILNNNNILNDVKLTVLDDFLNKFFINVDKNNVNVCTLLNVCL
jgi:hypothetical protein